MANQTHLDVLKEGYEAWNAWRNDNYSIEPDLSEADLREFKYPSFLDTMLSIVTDKHTAHGIDFSHTNMSGANLSGLTLLGADFGRANLSKAILCSANIRFANFRNANLSGADLTGTSLDEANFKEANLENAILVGAGLSGCELGDVTFKGANLEGADLQRSRLVSTNLEGTNLTGCHIYGLSAWDLNLESATQKNLIISPEGSSAITVDNLEVAQFIYLLLNNQRIRHVIDTITSKVILILGRFAPERKAVLDALREELRRRDYLPVLFDSDKPESKDVTGTVETLARLAKFIIADLSDPSSVPHELATLVPFLRTTPVLPLRRRGATGYSMFEDLQSYPWVLDTYYYEDVGSLMAAFAEVISRAEELTKRLRDK